MMTQNEKDQLLALLSSEGRWCQDTEAKDDRGDGVRYDDSNAVAWDLTGAVCRLFGWERALQLFAQLGRHVAGHKPLAGRYWRYPQDAPLASMAALQDFNDRPATSYEFIMDRLATMPVHQPRTPTPHTVTSSADLFLAHTLAREGAGETVALRMTLGPSHGGQGTDR